MPATSSPPAKTMTPVAIVAASISAASTTRRPSPPNRGARAHSTMGGATSSAPVTSPSHHVSQIEGAAAAGAEPPSTRQLTPIVAPIAVASAERNAKRNTSGARSKTSTARANRITSHAPSTPSSVLPAAIPADVRIAPDVVTFTTNAPAKIAGHSRRRVSSSAAIAIPVGGHTALALACTNASDRPSLPTST